MNSPGSAYFKGKEYLNTFWPENPRSSDVWVDNKFLLWSYIQVIQVLKNKFSRKLKCLDISTGPVLAPMIAMSPAISEVQLSEYGHSDEKTFDSTQVNYWKAYTEEILKLEEKTPTEILVKQRLAGVSDLVKNNDVIDVDLRRDNIFFPNVDTEECQLLTMHFVADSITKSKEEYREILGRVISLLHHDSVLLMSCLIECREWVVGKKSYPSPNLSLEYITKLLVDSKLNILYSNVQSKQPEGELGHDGRMAVIAAYHE